METSKNSCKYWISYWIGASATVHHRTCTQKLPNLQKFVPQKLSTCIGIDQTRCCFNSQPYPITISHRILWLQITLAQYYTHTHHQAPLTHWPVLFLYSRDKSVPSSPAPLPIQNTCHRMPALEERPPSHSLARLRWMSNSRPAGEN